MKRSFLMGLVIVSVFGILGCGGGSSAPSYTVVEIQDLNKSENGYAVSYFESLNIVGEIVFCSNEYNITGSIESNGSFSIAGTQIVFDENDDGSHVFQIETNGTTPGILKEMEWYEVLDEDDLYDKNIQIQTITEINCTG